LTSRKAGSAGRLAHAWPLIAVMLILVAGTAILAVQPAWLNRHLGIQDSPKITKLIYPTFGNPAIVVKGQSLTLEFDPRKQHWWWIFPRPMSFKVSARTSNGPAKVTRNLEVTNTEIGYSSRWPEYARSKAQDHRIYLVTVAVPLDLPHDLYDVGIESTLVLRTTKDMQPHALEAIDEYSDNYSFVQLTDIHVWGPEISYPGSNYHERSSRPNGIDPKREGAIYYRKAIDQVNLMHPDFAIFSGDYMFGQRYFVQDNGPPWGNTTEYNYEMMWFYQETMRLDVPVFIVMGNHDSYNEGDEGAGEDWFVNWRKLYGPVYHSFDYGDNHFIAANSQDWSAKQRVLNDWFGVILQPTKYKGQFQAGADKCLPGITQTRLDNIDEASFTGQLAWIRDDLKAHQGAKMRAIVMHHDPYKTDGSGEMWGADAGTGTTSGLKHLMGKVLDMGDGLGRLGMMKLMKDYRVSFEISGHDHSDYVATRAQAAQDLGTNFVDVFSWKGGGGEVKYINTTSTQFQSDGPWPYYPGYRRIWIDNGRVASFNYKDPKWSYPWYAGTNTGGETDLGALVSPAISLDLERPNATTAVLNINNTLDVPLPSAYDEVEMPPLTGGYYYVADNANVPDFYVDPGKNGGTVYQVTTDVPARSTKTVQLRKSDTPDANPPKGTLTIDGGTRITSARLVTLTINAQDMGGAGLRDMMVSNRRDFAGQEWRPYQQSMQWDLDPGWSGLRTVYLRVRDLAVPPNMSDVIEAHIFYLPNN
jgi:hypothetical protein